jgi:uncharacterized protein (DUF58 family)
MLTQDAIRRIRRIAITTRKEVETGFSGAYSSVFRGRGSQFDQVRPYQEGDPIRDIDWNVTARTGEPHIKVYTEERELTLLLVVDVSASGIFGSVRAKRELAAETAAILAFSAIYSGDKVGLLRFTDRVEQYVPPRKGTSHVWRVIRDLLAGTATGRGTNIGLALTHLRKIRRRRAVVVLLSDFLSPLGFERELRAVAGRHDLVAAEIVDPLDLALPNVGLIEVEDAEDRRRLWLDTSHAGVQRTYADRAARRRKALADLCARNGVDLLPLRTDEGAAPALTRFFETRKRRRR